MMHLTIPERTKLSDSAGVAHDAYRIHVNDAYHCTVRYSALLYLHETLRRAYEDVDRFGFPPKKIKYFTSEKELDERRDLLERYLRAVCQHPEISNSIVVINFLREAQRDSYLVEHSNDVDTHLAVHKLDGTKKLVHCTPGESSSLIVERLCESLSIPSHATKYFSLFIVAKSDAYSFKVVRWLQDVECPSISLYTAQQLNPKKSLKLVLRKNYWDIDNDEILLGHPSSLNLLYVQTVADVDSWRKSSFFTSDVNNRWSSPSEELLSKLKRLEEEKLFKEFIRTCQVMPRYGFAYFEDCLCDYPQLNTAVHLAFGNGLLIILYKSPDLSYSESAFRVNRMRCWKLTSRGAENSTLPHLSFEYLVARDQMRWISLYSKQSVLLSLCLQSMVTEIVKSRVESAAINTVLPTPPSKFNGDISSTSSFESFSSASSPLQTTRSSKNYSISTSSIDNEAFNTITDDDL